MMLMILVMLGGLEILMRKDMLVLAILIVVKGFAAVSQRLPALV